MDFDSLFSTAKQAFKYNGTALKSLADDSAQTFGANDYFIPRDTLDGRLTEFAAVYQAALEAREAELQAVIDAKIAQLAQLQQNYEELQAQINEE